MKNLIIVIGLNSLAFVGISLGAPLSQFYFIIAGVISFYLLKRNDMWGELSISTAVKSYVMAIIGMIAALVVLNLLNASGTGNSIFNESLINILIFVPFALVGEELFTASITAALENLGIKLNTALFIASIAFVAIHVPEYGVSFGLISIFISRIAFNYALKRGGIITSSIVHIAYDLSLISIFSLLSNT